MKCRRLLFRPAVLGLIALGALLAYRRFFFDWEGQPSCHKALELAVRIRMSEQKSNLYPNASGSSRGSIDLLKEFLSFPMDHYRYVPGLRPDDPGELVLFYFDQPTQERLVNRLAKLLAPGGTLYVGHSESLSAIDHGLRTLAPATYAKP